MAELGLPDYKRPPRRMVTEAQAARAAAKACHGTWWSHEAAQRAGLTCTSAEGRAVALEARQG